MYWNSGDDPASQFIVPGSLEVGVLSVLPQLMTPFLFWGAVVLHHGPAPELDLQIDLSLDDSVAVEAAVEPEGLNDVAFDDEPRLDLDVQLDQVSAEMARGRGLDG